MTEKFNPINIWNKHKYTDNDQIDQGREQRSSSLDQGKTDAQAQREPVQVFPSDFGSNVLNNPVVEQDSTLKNDSEDMISRNKKPTNYDLYNMKAKESTDNNTVDTGVAFFGDSNVARRSSRSTLDQEGLHRGNISTLPSAGESRRRSLQQQEKEPTPAAGAAPTSLFGRTAAAVSTLGAAAATATGLGVSEQLRDKSKQENTAMPSTWPESPKANNNGIEPAIHGQSACYKHQDQVCDTITDSDEHSFCDRVQEPSMHGQNPSFYQESSTTVNNTQPGFSSVNNTNAAAAQPGATHQSIAAAVGNATAEQQQRDIVNNNAAKPPSPARRLSNSISNLFNGNGNKSSPTTSKEKKSIWSAGNSMDTTTTTDKKGIIMGAAGLGAGLGAAAGLGAGALSRKNQINDPKSTDAYQLLGNEGTTVNKQQQTSMDDDGSVTESMDEMPQTWGDQSTPVVLDEQDPLSRPHAADRAFAEHDIGQHHATTTTTTDPTVRNASSAPTTTQAQIVHNDVDNNADHAKMGFDKKTGAAAAAGILGGAGMGAAIGSLMGHDKSATTTTTTTTTTTAGVDGDAFGNREQQAFGGSNALGTAPVAVTDTRIDQTAAAAAVANESTHAQIVHNDADPNADHAKMGFDKKTAGGAAGILGGAGIGAAIGSLVNHGNNNKDTASSEDDSAAAVPATPANTVDNNENQSTHAQIVHNDDYSKMGSGTAAAAGVLGGAGLGAAGVGGSSSEKNASPAAARTMDDGDQIIATPPPHTTHAQMVHNDANSNRDHAKMGFDKKPDVATRVGNLLKRNSHTEKDIHPFDNTTNEAGHNDMKKTGAAGILGGAGIGAAVGSLLHRKKTNEHDTTGVSEQQAFGVNSELDSTAVHPTAAAPGGTVSGGPVIHDNNNENAIVHNAATTPIEPINNGPGGPRRWSAGTITTPDHHVEKRLAVPGITGALANVEGRRVLNKLYPENTDQWDHSAPIASGLGEVEITDQPRRRSSVSETLGNVFGVHKRDSTTQETIDEANTPEPGAAAAADQPRRRSSLSETLGHIFGVHKHDKKVQEANSPEQGSSAQAATGVGAAAAVGAAATGAGLAATGPTTTTDATGPTTTDAAGPITTTDATGPTTTTDATGPTTTMSAAGPVINGFGTTDTGARPAINSHESISSTRATRGEIVPDRTVVEEEVKDRSGTDAAAGVGAGIVGAGATAAAVAAGAGTAGPQTHAAAAAPVQRDAASPPSSPRHRHSLQGIKDKAAAAVRRLSGRRSSSSIQKDSIQVRHLSDAEMYKNQTLGSVSPSAASAPAAAVAGATTTAATALGGSTTNNATTTEETPVTPDLRRGSTSSSEHLKYTGVQKGFARIPGVHTLRPAEEASAAAAAAAAPVNNAAYFIKEEENKVLPTKSSLISGHMEQRRGSIQKTLGKIIKSESMQDQGALKQVSGQSKITAYNAAHNKL